MKLIFGNSQDFCLCRTLLRKYRCKLSCRYVVYISKRSIVLNGFLDSETLEFILCLLNIYHLTFSIEVQYES